MTNNLYGFAHFVSMITEDIGILLNRVGENCTTFSDLDMEITHAIKYDTFFWMFANDESERCAIEGQYYTTLLAMLGIDIKSDYEHIKVTREHQDILRKYLDNMMNY